MNTIGASNVAGHFNLIFFPASTLTLKHAVPHLGINRLWNILFFEFRTVPFKTVQLPRKYFSHDWILSILVRCRGNAHYLIKFNCVRDIIFVHKGLGHFITINLTSVTANMENVVWKELNATI